MFNFQQLSFTANEDEGVLALCITFSGEIPAMENATLTVLTQDNSATGIYSAILILNQLLVAARTNE